MAEPGEYRAFDQVQLKLKKEVLLSEQARGSLQAGIDLLADTVRGTLGPRGGNVGLERLGEPPMITRDGVTVAEGITLPQPHQNMGAQFLKQAATATKERAGDGSTTAILLAQAIIHEGLKNIAAGANPMPFRRGLVKGAAAACAALEGMRRPLETMDEVAQVATIASGDPEIGEVIGQVMTKLGEQGFIHIQEDQGLGFEVEYAEGMFWKEGYVSSSFVTDQERDEALLEDPYVLITDRRVSRAEEVVPLMDQLMRVGEPRLLVIAEEVMGSALGALVVNKQRGHFNCLAVKPPAYGEMRKAMFHDLAILTGATLFGDELGRPLQRATLSDLGQVSWVVATHHTTTLVGGKGSPLQIEARIRDIQALIERTEEKYDRQKLEQRLAKLTDSIATIKIGGLTEAQRRERRRRLENGLSAARGAIKEGVVPGGGVALLNLIPALEEVEAETADEATALRCLQRAFEVPLRQLATNAGQDGGAVVGQVRWLQQKLDNPYIGYDVLRQEFDDVVEWGIMDPVPVLRAIVCNAISVAGMILTTEGAVGVTPGQRVRLFEPSERRRRRRAYRAELRERARREGGRLRPPRRVWPKPDRATGS